MDIPGVDDKSFQEIMQRSFRVSNNSSPQNKDLDYRPAPVMSDYDVFDDNVGYSKTRGSESSLNKNDIRPPGTEECVQEHDIFNKQICRKRSIECEDTSPNEHSVLPLTSKRPKEEPSPKIDYSPRFKFSCPDLTDASLPNELKLQFQPLFCKLCSVTLTSNTMARVHYVSKNHNKKVKNWLIEYSERTGESLHPRANSESIKKHQIENPSYYFCNICNIPLTGKLHSESHYMGRQHQKAVRGNKNPMVAPQYPDICDNKNTLPFLNEGCTESSKADSNESKGTNLACELCSVRVTCSEQLEQHLQGAKHKKKLKQIESCGLKKGSPDFSEYRTPSGFFYCGICKVTVNSAIQFKTHQESKKHRNKAGVS